MASEYKIVDFEQELSAFGINLGSVDAQPMVSKILQDEQSVLALTGYSAFTPITVSNYTVMKNADLEPSK